MEKKRPIFKDFDLPTMHLEGADHYVPPKARHEYEISRRRELPRGVLLAEYQQRGLLVARSVLTHLQDQEPTDIQFAANMLAASAINSAWYGLARNAPVMRRRLKLPVLAEEDRDYPPQLPRILGGAIGELGNAESHADMHIAALKSRSDKTLKQRHMLSRVVGNASLTIACLSFGPEGLDRLSGRPDDLVQQAVRRRGLLALNQANVLTEALGTAPSLAQLADPDSDLSVYWRRSAPTGAYEALEMAIAENRPH